MIFVSTPQSFKLSEDQAKYKFHILAYFLWGRVAKQLRVHYPTVEMLWIYGEVILPASWFIYKAIYPIYAMKS